MKKTRDSLLTLFVILIMLCGVLAFSACSKKKTTSYVVTLTRDPLAGGTVTGDGTWKSGDTAVITAATNDGYVFAGWYEEGTLLSDEASHSFVVTKDITITAKWTLGEFTLSFDTKDGESTASMSVKNGETVKKSALPIPLKSGFIFDGWYYDADCTEGYDETRVMTASITLYAKYTLSSDAFQSSKLVDDCTTSSAIIISSGDILSRKNIGNYVSLKTATGEDVTMSVQKITEGHYAVSSPDFMAGNAYTLSVIDAAKASIVGVTDKTEDYTGKDLSSLVIKIPLTSYVNTTAKQDSYRHLNLTTVEGYSCAEAGITADTVNINPSTDIGKDLFTVAVKKADHDPFTVGEIISLGTTDRIVDSDAYYKVLSASEAIEAVEEAGKTSYVEIWVLQLTYPEISDVYSTFDVRVSETVESQELQTALEKAASEQAFRSSEAYTLLTTQMAVAISSCAAYKHALDTLDDETNASYASAAAISPLIQGLDIKSNVRTTDDGYYAITVSITGEIEIKSVKISIQFTLTDKMKVEAFGETYWVSLSEGQYYNFGTDVTNIFSFSFAAGVSFIENGEAKEEDIGDEVSELLEKGVDTLQSLTDDSGIASILGDDPEYVDVFNVKIASIPIPVTNIITFAIDLSFNVKLAMAAGIQFSSEYVYVERTGCTNGYLETQGVQKKLRSDSIAYQQTLDKSFDYSVTLKGMLGIRAGVGVDFTVSVLHLNFAFYVGLGAEVGAYAELYGICTYRAIDKAVTGALYFELGIYAELNLKAKFLLVESEYTLAEAQFPLLKLGYEAVPMSFKSTADEITTSNPQVDLYNQNPGLFTIRTFNLKEMAAENATYAHESYAVKVLSGADDITQDESDPLKIKFKATVTKCDLVLEISVKNVVGVWSSAPLTKTVTIHFASVTIPESERHNIYRVSFYVLESTDDAGHVQYVRYSYQDVSYGSYPTAVSIDDLKMPNDNWVQVTDYPLWLTAPIVTDYSAPDTVKPENESLWNVPVTHDTQYYLFYSHKSIRVTFKVPSFNQTTGLISSNDDVSIWVTVGMTPKQFVENGSPYASVNEQIAKLSYSPTVLYNSNGWSQAYYEPVESPTVITWDHTNRYDTLSYVLSNTVYTAYALPAGTVAPSGCDYGIGSFDVPFTWNADGACVYKETGEVISWGRFILDYFLIRGTSTTVSSDAEVPTPSGEGKTYALSCCSNHIPLFTIDVYDSCLKNIIISVTYSATTDGYSVYDQWDYTDALSKDSIKSYTLFTGKTQAGEDIAIKTDGTLLEAIQSYFASMYGSAYDAATNVLTYHGDGFDDGLTYSYDFVMTIDGATKSYSPVSEDNFFVRYYVFPSKRVYQTGSTIFDATKAYVYDAESGKYIDEDLADELVLVNASLAGAEYDAANNRLVCPGTYNIADAANLIPNSWIRVNSFTKDGYSYTFNYWKDDAGNILFMNNPLLRGRNTTFHPQFVKTRTTYSVSVYDDNSHYTYENNSAETEDVSIAKFLAENDYKLVLPEATTWYHFEINSWIVCGYTLAGEFGKIDGTVSKDTRLSALKTSSGEVLVDVLLRAVVTTVWESATITLYAGSGTFATANGLVATDENGKQYVTFTGTYDELNDTAINKTFKTTGGIAWLEGELSPAKSADAYNTYAFNGWSTSSTATYGASDFGGDHLAYGGGLTYYATYVPTSKTATITMNAGSTVYNNETLAAAFDEAGTKVTTITVNVGSDYYYGSAFFPYILKAGYRFTVDYFTDALGTKYPVTDEGLTLASVMSDLTLTAHFNDPVLMTYSLYFFEGDHSITDKFFFQTGTVEDTIDLSGMPVATAVSDDKNWTVVGWTDASGNLFTSQQIRDKYDGKPFSKDEIYHSATVEDTTSPYTATFYAMGSNNDQSSGDLFIEGAFYNGLANQTSVMTTSGTPKSTLILPIAPTRTGGVFQGWIAESDLTSATPTLITSANLSSFTYQSNALYYASYAANSETYTVTFKADNGAFADGSTEKQVTMHYGQAITLSDVPLANIEGYEFGFWAGADYVLRETTVYAVYGKPVGTTEEFMAIAEDLAGTYLLTSDLDLGEISPLGSLDAPFSGILYGNGHALSYTMAYNGLGTQQDSHVTSIGLFAAVSGMISNLKYGTVEIIIAHADPVDIITDVPVTTNTRYVGALAGVIAAGGIIERIGREGNIIIGVNADNGGLGIAIGALAGANYGSIENCYFRGGGIFVALSSTTPVTVGAFTGVNGGTVYGCVAMATAIQLHVLTATRVTSGCFVGENAKDGCVKECYTTCNTIITVDNASFTAYPAGIFRCGAFAGTNEGTFNHCVSSGGTIARIRQAFITDKTGTNELGAEFTLQGDMSTYDLLAYDSYGIPSSYSEDNDLAQALAGNAEFAKAHALFAGSFTGIGNGSSEDCAIIDVAYDKMMHVYYTLVGLDPAVWNVSVAFLGSTLFYELILR